MARDKRECWYLGKGGVQLFLFSLFIASIILFIYLFIRLFIRLLIYFSAYLILKFLPTDYQLSLDFLPTDYIHILIIFLFTTPCKNNRQILSKQFPDENTLTSQIFLSKAEAVGARKSVNLSMRAGSCETREHTLYTGRGGGDGVRLGKGEGMGVVSIGGEKQNKKTTRWGEVET